MTVATTRHDQIDPGRRDAAQLSLDLGLSALRRLARPRRRSRDTGASVAPHGQALPTGRKASPQSLVEQFHLAFGLPAQKTPDVHAVDAGLAALRVDLILEEAGEFKDATAERDLVKIADAIADILYVTYGAAVTYGIDAHAVLEEVHRSNMSKLGDDGRPILREDGKVLKSARYFRPDVRRVLAQQGALFPDA